MPCSVVSSSKVVGKKWSIPIIEEIALGKFSGFNAFSKNANITPHVLSMRLSELEKAELVKKIIKDGKNNTTEYSLTAKGREMHAIIRKMKRWSIRWEDTPKSCLKTSCIECGRFS